VRNRLQLASRASNTPVLGSTQTKRDSESSRELPTKHIGHPGEKNLVDLIANPEKKLEEGSGSQVRGL
jgi:hypothetical protein